MRGRRRVVGRLVAGIVVALLMGVGVGVVAGGAQGDSSTTFTARGTFVFNFAQGTWSKDCTQNSDGTTTCTITGTGSFHGGISGDFLMVVTGTSQPGHPFPTSLVPTAGHMYCEDCIVAGRSGDITFDVSWISNVQIVGTLTVQKATGELKGLTGAGSFGGTFPNACSPYTLDLTLPE